MEIKMSKYPSYKDAGVEWLGKIPEHWDVLPGLSFIFENKERNKGMIRNKILSLSYGNIRVKGEDELTGLVPESFETYQFVNKGDLIFRPTDLQNDTVSLRSSISEYDGIITNAYLNLRFKSKAHSKFFHYFFRAIDNNKVIYGLGSGLRQNISYLDFRRFQFPFPPLPEQTAIAHYLDEKTALIDKAIDIKQKQIALLKERRQVIIQHAVTRGLDPNVKLKDSGVEWIGEIPEEWEVKRNSLLFLEKKLAGNESLPILSVSIHTAVSNEQLSDEENIRGQVRIEDKASYKMVKPGYIVYNMMRAWQGGIGCVEINGMVSPAYVVAEPNSSLNSKYFEFQYRTVIFIQQMDQNSRGITDFRKRLYWNEFKQLLTLVPPVNVQSEIVDFINSTTYKIATAISLKEKEIDKLKEYKATLINSAVTGKIKVT